MASAPDRLPGLEWQCPPQAIRESSKLGWLDDVVSEGQSWLKSQRGYSDFRKALDILSGTGAASPRAEYRSKVSTNRLKRNCREVVGTCAKLRPIWGYHSDNAAYAGNAEMMNKVTRAWYLESFADRRIKDALYFAAGTCRGWVRPVYRRDMFGTGHGDIKLLTYGSPCVLPFQLPQDGDWQSAYAVTILEEMPVAMAHGMWPQFQHRLNPSASRFWYSNDAVRAASRGNLMQRIFGQSPFRRSGGSDVGLSDLLVPIRYTYVIDLSLNTTAKEIPMGEPGSSWAYTVPPVGGEIPMGRDPRSGSPLTRRATENDARLYPYRRLIISSDACVMYDGPSFDWHGMLPLVSFCLDDLPWEPLGFSLAHDGYELQKALDETLRGNADKTRSAMDMGMAYDQNVMSLKDARSLDPMQPRVRVGYDASATEGPPMQPLLPPEVLKITPESLQQIAYYEQTMDNQMAINDMMSLAKLRGAGTMGDMEKVLEANGPIIEDMSRSMEPPMRDLGTMVKYLVMQYYTTTRVMQIVGAEGVAPEVFDYNPDSLIPSHAPSEDPQAPSAFAPRLRARIFADNLRFFIVPHSLHEITQMAYKLGLIQLRKAGLMIDSETIAEAWNVRNYGHIDGNTVMERWKTEQEMQLEFMARAKAIGEELGLAQGQPPGGAGPGKKPEGRPPSGQAAPALKQKDGGSRQTVTESK